MSAFTYYRRAVHTALAALVVAASVHCAWEWQAGLKHAAVAAKCRAARQSLPMVPGHGCDNEYGCICRGATIVHFADVSHCKPLQCELLTADLAPTTLCGVVDLADNWAWSSARNYEFSVPPLSGRQVRALYASLVI